MSKLFGTDSARGIAVAELTCEIALQAGRAAAAVLSGDSESRAKIVVGKDEALSSDILEAAVCAGICSAGADAEGLGRIPAPAVAYLVKEHKAAAGIMISEAHNGNGGSGIRLFSPEARRFGKDVEEQIENLVFGLHAAPVYGTRIEPGRMLRSDEAADEYISHITGLVNSPLNGLRVAIDCASGCSSTTAERLFTTMGAEVLIVPEPENEEFFGIGSISTKFEQLMDFVTVNNCDCGLAFSSDGTSCLAVDENGKQVDGDSILAVLSKHYKENGTLKDDTIAVNSMCSLGLLNFARENEIHTVSSGSAGRNVLDRMIEGGYQLGGERSGHIIFLEDAPSGDGQLCGARLLEVMKLTGKKLSELAGEMQRLPQIVLNVRISPDRREIWKNDAELTGLISQHELELGSEGRVLVRESGSMDDPFIRVMVEGKEFSHINNMAMEIARCIKQRCSMR